jgi:hypothetical protein
MTTFTMAAFKIFLSNKYFSQISFLGTNEYKNRKTKGTLAASHLVPNTFSPWTFGPPQLVPKNKQSRLIWSPRQLVPVDKQSQKIWSPWTNGPQDYWSPRQLVPLEKQSPNIWSPWTNGPQDNWSPWTIGPQNLLVYSKSGLEPFFQFFDTRWSTLDIMNDFKPISNKNYLCFGEINQSLLLVFVQKHFLLLFSIRNGGFRQKLI